MKSRVYSPKLLPLIQSLSATLADIEFAHEREMERLEGPADDWALQQRRMDLEQAYRERRAPYVEQLAELQARVRAGMPDSDAA